MINLKIYFNTSENAERLKYSLFEDTLDRVESKFKSIPWYNSRGIAAGILAACDMISHKDIKYDIMNKIKDLSNDEKNNFSSQYLLAINAFTERFNSLGKFFPKFSSEPIEEIASKETILKIGEELNKIVPSNDLKSLLGKINNTDFNQSTDKKNVDPVILNYPDYIRDNNTELTPNTLNQLKEAFGELLDNRNFIFKKQGYLITLHFNDIIDGTNCYMIDPSIIMGEGYDIFMYDAFNNTVLVNIKQHRDIVKKYLNDINYRLNIEEVKDVRKYQFKSDILYSVLDLSGMVHKLRTLSDSDKQKLEENLNKIFFKSDIFNKYLRPKFRFKIFKNPSNFTLVCDEHTKNIIDTGTPMYPASIIVYDTGYQVSLKPDPAQPVSIVQDYDL